MILKSAIVSLTSKLEVDQAVFFSILSKIWGLVAGPISALMIVFFFSSDIQGYYYTFGTILALQVFIELGLGLVTQQFISHEWSKLSFDSKNDIVGDENSLSRLISIARISFKWFSIGAIIATVGLVFGGYIFFYKSQVINVEWKLPWIFLCFTTGVTIVLTPIWSILEGCNQVKQVYRFRFFQGIILSITVWVSITLGALLWTGFIANVVSLICIFFFLYKKYWHFLKVLAFKKISGQEVNWKHDMLPMQWKIAVSWISGYFCSSLITPVLFKYQGPEIAGQFGMTWGIVGMIVGIAASWISPKAPKIAILVAQKKYKELDKFFFKIVRIIFIISFSTSLFIWIIILLLNKINFPPAQHFAARLISPLPVALLLIAQLFLIISTPFSVYMRAHKQEPGMYLSVAAGIMIGISTLILGKYYSVIGVSIGYLCTHIIIVPLVFLIWYRKHKIWTSVSF